MDFVVCAGEMMLFRVVLVLATVLCSLVAGFLVAFATVIMPGIGNLDDGAFIRAFQVIDGVIQKKQPVFVFVWVGSVLALVAAAIIGWPILDNGERQLVAAAVLLDLIGVQAPTFIINVPLNNALQRIDIASMDAASRARARHEFESLWNRWNVRRTVLAVLVSVLLVMALLRV